MGSTSSIPCTPSFSDESDRSRVVRNDRTFTVLWCQDLESDDNKEGGGFMNYTTTHLSDAAAKYNSLSSLNTEVPGVVGGTKAKLVIQNKKILESSFVNELWKTNILNYATKYFENGAPNYNKVEKRNAIAFGRFGLQMLVKESPLQIIDPNALEIQGDTDFIGKGYQAESVNLRFWKGQNKKVAIKAMNIINQWHMNQKGFRKGVEYQLQIIRNEMRVFEQVKHNNILQSSGGYIHSNGIHYCFVCDLLAIKLKDFVRKDYNNWKDNKPQDYPPKSYRSALAGLADGISEFHKHKFVHRDLHKSNVLLRWRGDGLDHFEFVLIDFGLSLKENESQLFQDGSTRHYSPESCKNFVVYTTKSDVFSFGTMMYEVMNGCQNIFGKKSDADALELLSKGMMPKIDKNQCNSKYAEAIQKCWILDVKQRIDAKQACQILQSSW
eukprot:228467_1